MKNILSLLLTILLFLPSMAYAQKVTALTENTVLNSKDLLYTVDDVSGTATGKKLELETLGQDIFSSDGVVNFNSIGGTNNENLGFDLETVANEGAFVTSSGVTAFVFFPGTKHDGYKIRIPAEVQTTDATVTVLDTITLLDENTYHIEAFIVAVQSTGAERASYHIAATVYRTGAGSATLQGTVTSVHTQESDANLAATFTVSSNDIRVSVTGIVSETWEWGTTVTYINMSN